MTATPHKPPTAAEILHARRALAQVDLALAVADSVTPPFVWRVRDRGFAGLAKLIVEQQVSVASAAAIWGRMEAGLGAVTPHAVVLCSEAGLRGFGLSGGKARYVHGLAEAEISGAVDLGALDLLDDETAGAVLRGLKGVGRWTAETYLMFCEGRLDILPAGDVALQHAVRMAEGAPAKPSELELYARAEAWRPYRGVAAHLLWAYYGGVKRGEIVAPKG